METPKDLTLYDNIRLYVTLPPQTNVYTVNDTFTVTVSCYTPLKGMNVFEFTLNNIDVISYSSDLYPGAQINKQFFKIFTGVVDTTKINTGFIIIAQLQCKIIPIQPGQTVLPIFGKLISMVGDTGGKFCEANSKTNVCSSFGEYAGGLFTPGSNADIHFNHDPNMPISSPVGYVFVKDTNGFGPTLTNGFGPTLTNRQQVKVTPAPFMAAIDTSGKGYYFYASASEINNGGSCSSVYKIQSARVTAFKDLCYSFGQAMCLDNYGNIYYNPIFPNDIWHPVSSHSFTNSAVITNPTAAQLSFDGNTLEVAVLDSQSNCYYSNNLCIKWSTIPFPATGLTFKYIQCSNGSMACLCSDKNVYYKPDCTTTNNWTQIVLSPDSNTNTPIVVDKIQFNAYNKANKSLMVITPDSTVYNYNDIMRTQYSYSYSSTLFNYVNIQDNDVFFIDKSSNILMNSVSLERTYYTLVNIPNVKQISVSPTSNIGPPLTNDYQTVQLANPTNAFQSTNAFQPTNSFQPTPYNTMITTPFKSSSSPALVKLKSDISTYIKTFPNKHPNARLRRLNQAFNYLLYQSPGQVKDSINLMKQIKKTHGESAYAGKYDANIKVLQGNAAIKSELDKFIQRYNKNQ